MKARNSENSHSPPLGRWISCAPSLYTRRRLPGTSVRFPLGKSMPDIIPIMGPSESNWMGWLSPGWNSSASNPVAVQHGAQGQAGETHAAIDEE